MFGSQSDENISSSIFRVHSGVEFIDEICGSVSSERYGSATTVCCVYDAIRSGVDQLAR
jgi:hypothetical protein